MLIPFRRQHYCSLKHDQLVAVRCVCALVMVTAFGTVGFMLIEREWSVWKSLFFTLITITTVGYGDEGLSSSGEVFAAIVLLLGIGTATYSLSSLVQMAVCYQSSWKRRMNNHIKQLSDHFIISGFGRIGQTVGERLQASEIPFVIVDPKIEKIETALARDYLAIQGDSADDEVLLAAGINRARGIICATNSDAENVFVTLSARELNPGLFIAARASTEGAANKMRRAGASLVVSPYTSAGHQITDAILRPMAQFLTDDRAADLDLSVLRIDEKTAFLERSIGEISDDFPDVIVVSISSVREGRIFRPDRLRRLEVGDNVTVAGRNSDLDRIHRAADLQAESSINA